jgi:pyridoxal biosynthesis lyase PdxS
MRDIGVDAMFVGETLVKSQDVYQTARMMVQAGR